MQWQNLTAPEFAKAVKKTGVCLVPMGVIEKHGEHLPLGTDVMVAHRTCCLAAEQEPAVVFPPWFFGQIFEARAFPGCLTIKPTLLVTLLENIFDEIGRNGFRKVVLVNGHGGNKNLLPFVAQCTLSAPRPYSVYVSRWPLTAARQKHWDAVLETGEHGHACECESSMVMAICEDLVKMKAVPKKSAEALGRMKDLSDVFTAVSWYADYPEHYAGDASRASAEKGRKLLQLRVDDLVEQVRRIKADKVVPALETEFYERSANPCGIKTPRRRSR